MKTAVRVAPIVPHITPIGELVSDQFDVKIFTSDSLLHDVWEYFIDSVADAIMIADQQALIGIMTLKDTVRLLSNSDNLSLPVQEFMTAPLYTFDAQKSIADVIDAMSGVDFNKIVVTRHNGVIGIIDKRHLLSICYDHLSPLIKYEYNMIHSIMGLASEGQHGLLKMATTDALTGIGNRRLLEEAFKAHQMLEKRYEIKLFLLMFDIDDFKSINDTFGHNIGDLVLKEMTELVSGSIRKSDIFVRWGGEEFTVMLNYSDPYAVMKIAENIRERIDKNHFKTIVHVTCSFGLTRVNPNESLEQVILRADKALYKAKSEGKNCVRMED